MVVKRSFYIDTIGRFITSALGTLASLFTGILIARFLGPEGKGTLTIVLLVIGQTGMFFTLGVEIAIIYYAARSPKEISTIANSSIGLGLLLGLVGMGVTGIIFAFISNEVIPVHLYPFLILMASTIPMSQATLFLRSLIRVSGRIVEEGMLGMISTFLNLSLIGMVLIAGYQLKGALIGLWLAAVILTFFIFILGVRWNLVTSWPIISISKWKSLVRYGIKLHIGSMFQTLNYRIDMYLVAFFLGSGSVGLYSVGVAIGEWLWVIPGAIGVSLMQRVTTNPENIVNRMVGVINRLTATILALGALFLSFLGYWLIQLLYGEAFSDSYIPLVLLLPGIWALGLWKNFINDLSVRGYPAIKSYTSGVAMLLTLALDILFIPRWGINGAAIASSIAYMTAAGIALKIYCRITGCHPRDLLVIRQEDIRLVFQVIKNNLKNLQTKSIKEGKIVF